MNLIAISFDLVRRPRFDLTTFEGIDAYAEYKAEKLRKSVSRRGEKRLVEAGKFRQQMSIDEKLLLGQISEWFIRRKFLSSSQMRMLGELIKKYKKEERENG